MRSDRISEYLEDYDKNNNVPSTIENFTIEFLLIVRSPHLFDSLIASTGFLVTIMGLMIPWSVTMGLVDAYSVFVKLPTRQPGVMIIIIVGDWVLSFLSLGAACSTASVAQILLAAKSPLCPGKICSRYSVSAAMAFLSWFMSFASSLFNFWILPKL